MILTDEDGKKYEVVRDWGLFVGGEVYRFDLRPLPPPAKTVEEAALDVHRAVTHYGEAVASVHDPRPPYDRASRRIAVSQSLDALIAAVRAEEAGKHG